MLEQLCACLRTIEFAAIGHQAFTYHLFQAMQNNVLAAGLSDVTMVSCCIKSLQMLQSSVP